MEVVEIPQLPLVEKIVSSREFLDKVVDMPAVVNDRCLWSRKCIKLWRFQSIEISQLQYIWEVVDVPVVLVVHAPQSQVVAETAEIPQLQVVENIGFLTLWRWRWGRGFFALRPLGRRVPALPRLF